MTETGFEDDVVELCRRAQINPATYVRFPISQALRAPARPKLQVAVRSGSIEADLTALAFAQAAASGIPLLPILPSVGGCGATTVLTELGSALSALGKFHPLAIEPNLLSKDSCPERCLVVLTPELRSLQAAKILSDSIASRPSHARIEAAYLVNRFEETKHTHRAMAAKFEELLGSCLLPVRIPDSNEIEEALLAGTSVIEYAPQSQVTAAFFQLAEWWRGLASKQEVKQLVQTA